MGLDRVGEGRATTAHGPQDLRHVAEGQKSLGPGAGLHQPHGAGDQGDLARAENGLIHLEKRAGEATRGQRRLTDARGDACLAPSYIGVLACKDHLVKTKRKVSKGAKKTATRSADCALRRFHQMIVDLYSAGDPCCQTLDWLHKQDASPKPIYDVQKSN